MVDNGQTGLTFKYKDIDDLRSKVSYMYEHQDEARRMGETAYQQLLAQYSPSVHYEKLMGLFNELIKIPPTSQRMPSNAIQAKPTMRN